MTRKWLPFLIVLTFVFAVPAQSTQPKTVTDYFRLLPEKYFAPYSDGAGAKPTLSDYRRSIVKIEDIKNGYLRIEEPTHEGWSEVAIFKKTDGKYILGISQVGCGPGCSNEEMIFFSYDGGNWSDVTKQVLPEITSTQIDAAYRRHKIKEDEIGGVIYALPRTGTTIKVTSADSGDADSKSVVFFELSWNGTKFVLKNK